MSWNDIAEVIKAVSPVFTAAAACCGVYIGWKGLEKWRVETTGRKRMELAEEVLADVYEAIDVFKWVRSPIAFSTERQERPGRDEELEEIRGHRDTFYVPLKRLSEQSEFFSRLRARRYKVIATFGQEKSAIYEEIYKIHAEIASAARALMRIDPRRTTDQAIQRQERFEAIVWDGFGDADPLADRLSAIVAVAERDFRGEIMRSDA